MQLRYITNTVSPTNQLQKCTSLPSLAETAHSSKSSIESHDEEYRKSAIKWILNFQKKVSKDTQYLAISYLNVLLKKNVYICEQNYQKIAVCVLAVAAKINEVYPPKITSMLAKCKKPPSKDEVIMMEGTILNALGFAMYPQGTPYSWLASILSQRYTDKLQECEKLLRIVSQNKDIYQFGDEILAYSIIYLIIPNYIRQMKLKEGQKVKMMAIKLYNLYNEYKQKYQKSKENKCNFK